MIRDLTGVLCRLLLIVSVFYTQTSQCNLAKEQTITEKTLRLKKISIYRLSKKLVNIVTVKDNTLDKILDHKGLSNKIRQLDGRPFSLFEESYLKDTKNKIIAITKGVDPTQVKTGFEVFVPVKGKLKNVYVVGYVVAKNQTNGEILVVYRKPKRVKSFGIQNYRIDNLDVPLIRKMTAKKPNNQTDIPK